MFTNTGKLVTFCMICARGPIFSTVPSKVRFGNASTVIVTGRPGCTRPMSVSATMAESWTASRFAILRITVPPPNVGLRSEERRVGKECRARGSPDHYKKNRQKSEEHDEQVEKH